MTRHRPIPLLIALMACIMHSGIAGTTLDADDLATLTAYVDRLDAGGVADPAVVDALAEADFPCLRLAMARFAALDADASPATQRAYLAIIDRLSREALDPWPMTTLYSPQLAAFMVGEADVELAEALYAALARSAVPRAPWDLAVRLTPGQSLRHLAATAPAEQGVEMAAWVRRLRRSGEYRPIPELEAMVLAICKQDLTDASVATVSQHLGFRSGWRRYGELHVFDELLLQALRSEDREMVAAGLRAQTEFPRCLGANPDLVTAYKDDDVICRMAIENFAYTTEKSVGAAEILRDIWKSLSPDQAQQRYACIFAMGLHPAGNEALALDAIRERPAEYLDIGVPLLRYADPAAATALVRDVLQVDRAHEPALRLAREMKLPGLEADAVRLLQESPDLIVKLAAIHYLATVPGEARRALLPAIRERDMDIRLAAITAIGEPVGLTAADREAIGPALVRVAISDVSPGHRQEALFALARWQDESTRELFVKLRRDHAAASGLTAPLTADAFWPHRYWLVSTLGLAMLGEADCLADLSTLLDSRDPALRMEALMVYNTAGIVPEQAFAALAGMEPKLVATAATVIASHGSAEQRRRMHDFFAQRPMYEQFALGGIDDHNILHIAGLDTDD